ncbi:MAG: 3-dehydroquinate synthase [Acidimicrobiia bacterium]|nr:3-dehydroquinate synthase [Acidimicrobiia bacterium]
MAVSGPEVLIGRGLLKDAILPEREERRRVAVVTDAGADGIARPLVVQFEEAGMVAGLVEIPVGEAAKSLAVAESVFEALNRLGLSRGDTVVAVGGGAVTDLAGFVAATYLRGIEAVYCPTTLLGAVDASIGGKTGVNVGGKNLVGVFAHPSRVVIDIGVLENLPTSLTAQGMAEALKAGLIGDPELVDLLEEDGLGADLEQVVRRAVAVKVQIVAEDFRESGRRAALNYGHTIGHAVEIGAGLSHGEAVAVGMVAAGWISTEQAGFSEQDRVLSIISQLELPVRLSTALDPARVLELVRLDKKRDADGIRMVLLEAIGVPVVRAVDEATVLAGLQAVSPV